MNRVTLGWRSSVQRHSRPRRTGMILAVVLVALLIVMLLGAAIANAFLAQRQLARDNQQRQQAFWLAESALHRAAHRLANEPGYEGETWQVSADDLGGTYAGIAIVRVETISEDKPGRRIIVDATYPSGALKESVQHRELFVAPPTE